MHSEGRLWTVRSARRCSDEFHLTREQPHVTLKLKDDIALNEACMSSVYTCLCICVCACVCVCDIPLQ